MSTDPTQVKSRMIFAPAVTRRRLQLRISERRLLLVLGDVLASLLAVFVASAIWSYVGRRAFLSDTLIESWIWFIVLPLLWVIVANANGFYELALAARRDLSFQKLVQITLQVSLIYVFIFFFSPVNSLPRLFILYYAAASFFLVTLLRMLNPSVIGWAVSARSALIVGTDWATETILEALRKEAPEAYQVVGIIGREEEVGQVIRGVPVIGSSADLMNYVLRDQVREIVLTSTRELPGDLFQAVMDAYERGVTITPMPILYERITERVPVEHVGSAWAVVLPIGDKPALTVYGFQKRLMDLVLAGAAGLVFALLLPFIALAIRLDSRGSIFYSQVRVGRNGRYFEILKFRTMIADAEKFTGAVFAEANDPRVTRVGRFLRKSRLDELPQIINILRGEMSVIGPRPERPEHVQRLQQSIPFYRTRHVIRPGLTGWAQVRYRYGADDHDALMKLQYDLYYIRHQSALLDLTILIRTVGRVLTMAGQ